jgi:hypothetical protein
VREKRERCVCVCVCHCTIRKWHSRLRYVLTKAACTARSEKPRRRRCLGVCRSDPGWNANGVAFVFLFFSFFLTFGKHVRKIV